MSNSTAHPLFSQTADYRDYLQATLQARAGGSRGLKLKLSAAIGCQPGFVSQVLGKHAHFNLEHGEKINAFLGHTAEEAHYFLILIQRTRAGTPTLARYFLRQLEEIQERHLVLKNRFPSETSLSAEDRSRYYSAWHFGAIRVLLTIPEFQTREKIAERLRLPLAKITEVLEFLSSRGLAVQDGDRYLASDVRMHLGNDSDLITRHHTNWRNRALSSLDLERASDLHYSSVVSLSRQDAVRVKEVTIQFLEKIKAIVRESPAEELFSFNLDFFEP